MRICVYGASSTELDRKYTDATYELGRDIAKRGHGLVYGGGAQGVMGSTARGVRDGGGEIIGVTPEFFNVDGVVFQECTQLIFTKTMREDVYKRQAFSPPRAITSRPLRAAAMGIITWLCWRQVPCRKRRIWSWRALILQISIARL